MSDIDAIKILKEFQKGFWGYQLDDDSYEALQKAIESLSDSDDIK